MSDIKAQIKELEKLQKKVDFLKQVREFPRKLKAVDSEEKSILPEVCKLISELIDPIIENLELGNSEVIGTLGVVHEQNPFTEEEVEIVKNLIARAKNKPINKTSEEGEGETSNTPVYKSQIKNRKASVEWAKENQNLEGKRVKTMVLSSTLEGEVVSLNNPFVVIKLDNGKIHQATLDKLQIIEGI